MMRPATVEPPSWYGAAHARNLTSAALRMTYQLRPHGAHHVGTSGPLIMVTTCEAVLAGSIIRALCPRPIHVVANAAMGQAVPPSLLAKAGDLAISGVGALATQRSALAALDDGRAVLIAGSEVAPGYLVAVSGAPVLPVVVLGADGAVPTDPPRPRSTINIYFSPPVGVPVPGDPLLAATRAVVTEHVRQLVADAGQLAGMRNGRHA
jgi:1-acyl-sn-glycerol-3-phosphate acyltransferase